MNLDTSFLASAEAPVDSAPAPESVIQSTEPTETITPDITPDAPIVDAPVEGEPPVAAPEGEQLPVEEEELTDEEIQKLMDDPKAPKWFRDKLKQVSGYSHKLRTERDTIQQQLEEFRQTYEKNQLPETDLERMRTAEERQYKLSSFNTTPEEILSSLKEIVPNQKFEEIKSRVAWGFLETPDGQPDVDNLQVVIDRFTGYTEGDKQVSAKDVLKAIDALKRGTIEPHQLHEFASDAEYQAYEKARQIEEAAAQREQLARQNAEFQEKQTRTSVLKNVEREIQYKFQPQVEGLLDKFQLMPVEGEPKVSQDMKAAIQQRLANVIGEAQARSPHLTELWKGIEMLQKPTGASPESIQAEINAFTNSFPYQTALSKGLRELMDVVEKTVSEEAYRYSLMMEGYKARVAKGQDAREVIGQPKQTEVLNTYTPDQLAKMSAAERRHARLMEVSNRLRDQASKTNRYGG